MIGFEESKDDSSDLDWLFTKTFAFIAESADPVSLKRIALVIEEAL